MNAIKLNPSQTLRLVDERKKFFANRAQDSNATEEEKIFFTAPLICVLEENFSRENFSFDEKNLDLQNKKNGQCIFFSVQNRFATKQNFRATPLRDGFQK